MNPEQVAQQVLELSGVKKKKKAEVLGPVVSSIIEATIRDDDEAALLALYGLEAQVQREFLMGANGKYEAIMSVLAEGGHLPASFGQTALLRAHFDASQLDLKKSFANQIEEFTHFILLCDSMVTDGKSVHRFSSSTEFAIIEEGSNTEQYVFAGQYFTGGAALLLGTGADIQKKGKDQRRAFFVVADKGWQLGIPLDPEKTGDAQNEALRLRKVVESIAAPAVGSAAEAPRSDAQQSLATQIRELTELKDAGALSEEEFSRAKSRILGDS